MKTKYTLLGGLLLCTLLSLSVVVAQEATPEATAEMSETMGELPDRVTVVSEGLFPEGVEYDTLNERFLVSSVGHGTVHAVADDGSLSLLVEDERIVSSVGIEADEANNRLLVAVTDQETQGFLGIYDLTTGENLAFVDFRPLTPNDPEHFINDVAVDSQGNAYVTDSFAGVIYRVDPQGNATIFLEDQSFSTQAALNGIAYNEAGDYLLAVRVPDLIKIPLSNPAAFTTVQLAMPLAGADGIVFLDDSTLAVVTNNPPNVYRLESNDEFAAATITGVFEPGNVFPTTVAARDGEAYVLYAHLNAQEETVTEFPIQRASFADIAQDDMEMTPEATPGQ